MRVIPTKLLNQILVDPYYKVCARKSADCEGRITFEHAWIYSGRQINEAWAIIPLCTYHHLGKGLNKDVNRLISLSRATTDDLKAYPKRNWQQELNYLKSKYNQHE